jgi:hypothetical protein
MKVIPCIFICVVATVGTCKASEPVLRGSQEHRQAVSPTVGRVTKFRLMNADTDQPISGYDPLPNNSRIDVSTLPTTNLNVEALTDGFVGSIQWSFDGTGRNENVAPWALCGNSGSDFFACSKLKEGVKSSLRATPYLGRDATGAVGGALSVDIELFKSNLAPSWLILMTADHPTMDRQISILEDGTEIKLSLYPEVNVRMFVDSDLARSVAFFFDGSFYRIDNGAPYSFNGNSGLNYFPWTPTVGRHNITAIAYTDNDAKGPILAKASASFIVSGPDVNPPRLVDLKALSPLQVDVTKAKASVQLQAIVQDDVAGVSTANGYAILGNASLFSAPASQVYAPFSNEDSAPHTWNMSFEFDVSYPTGDYYISFDLRDNANPRN